MTIAETPAGSEAIKAKTRAFMAKNFPHYELRDDEDIFSIGFVNSLFALQLVMFVEKEFSVVVEDDDLNIDNFRTLNAIAALVQSKSAA